MTQQSVTLAASSPLIQNIGYRKRKGNDVNGTALVRAQSYIISLLAVCFQTHILKKYIRYIAWNSYNIWQKMCGVWFYSFTDPGNAEFVQHPKKYCVCVCVCTFMPIRPPLSMLLQAFPSSISVRVSVCLCVTCIDQKVFSRKFRIWIEKYFTQVHMSHTLGNPLLQVGYFSPFRQEQ